MGTENAVIICWRWVKAEVCGPPGRNVLDFVFLYLTPRAHTAVCFFFLHHEIPQAHAAVGGDSYRRYTSVYTALVSCELLPHLNIE